MTENYTFDPQTGLLTNQKAIRGTTNLIDLSYQYTRGNSAGSLNGKTGHLTKIINNLNTQKNREYEFDAVGRLTMAKGGPTGTLWTQTYTYDRWGNRTNVAKTGTAAGGGTLPLDGIAGLTYDNASNRLNKTIGAHQFQYDVNGNQTKTLAEDGSTWVRYEYDSANRLWLVKRDSDGVMLQRFGYGATNARFQSLDALANKWTLYAATGGNVLAEYIENSPNTPSWAKSYTYFGGSQLATITPNGGYTAEITEFNHPDRLGTRLVTSQAGGTSYEQTHLPFGRSLDAESGGSTAQIFTSYERSSITKLDYAVNRTYDSKLGRFSQVDPIGMQAVSLAAPQTLNMYAYCINDPVNYTDPSGLFLGSFFRWLGRLLLGLSRSRVARRIAIKFVVNFALSGGNFGVAIRSVIPDILQSTGIFPDPRSTVPWYPGSRLPISLGTSSLSKYIILNLIEVDDAIIFELTFTAIWDAYQVLRTDLKCAKFFGLLDRKGKFSEAKFKQLTKGLNIEANPKTRGAMAHTNGKNISLNSGFYNDGWFKGSPAQYSMKIPRQGRAQTVLHEIGHTKGLLISPDNYGYPTDPKSPGNQNEKKILDNCGKGLEQVATSY